MNIDPITDPLDASARIRAVTGRALVLGGGGSTGNAWLIGVLAGLADSGLDLAPDLIIGTSAGATAAAQITGAPLPELCAAALTPLPPRRERARGSDPANETRPGGAHPVRDHLAELTAIIGAASDAADFRRRIGARSLGAGPDGHGAGPDGSGDDRPAWSRTWRSIVATRLPRQLWPDQTVALTCVDARTGDGVILDRDSGVDLVDAVAASCSSGTAYHLGDRDLIDGGYLRSENAFLASGCETVLVLSPLGAKTLHPPQWRTGLDAQVEELTGTGARVDVIVPEPVDEHLFGANAMNAGLRPDAARTGFDQGQRIAEEVAAFWG